VAARAVAAVPLSTYLAGPHWRRVWQNRGFEPAGRDYAVSTFAKNGTSDVQSRSLTCAS
jgi:hypothetical protein